MHSSLLPATGFTASRQVGNTMLNSCSLESFLGLAKFLYKAVLESRIEVVTLYLEEASLEK